VKLRGGFVMQHVDVLRSYGLAIVAKGQEAAEAVLATC
jgi:hypothetical protein